jgi:hypothetical protein
MFDFIAKLFGGGQEEQKKKKPQQALPFDGPFRNAEFARQNAVQQASLGRRSLNPQLATAPAPQRQQFQVPSVRPAQVLLSRPQPQVKPSNPIESLGRMAAGSNEKFFGEGARNIVRLANTLGGDLLNPNQQQIEKKTNDFLRSTGQVNRQGIAPLSQGIDRSKTSFKVGQAAGDIQRTAAEIAASTIPAVKAERLLQGSLATRGILQGGSVGQRIGRNIIPTVGSGALSSAITQGQNTAQNAAENFGTGAAIDAASTLLGPLGSAISRSTRARRGVNSLPAGQAYTTPQMNRNPQRSPEAYRNRNERVHSLPEIPQRELQEILRPDIYHERSYGAGQIQTSDASLTAGLRPQTQIQLPTQARATISNPENYPYKKDSRIKIPDNNDTSIDQSQVRTRGFASSVLDSSNLPPEMRQGLMNKDLTYNVRNTQDLVNRAGKTVENDLREAERIASAGSDDEAQAIGLELLRKYQDEGNYDAAINRVEDIAKKATENGRASQILAAYGKLTPEGALRFTQRQIDKYNESRKLTGSDKAARLTPDKAAELSNIAKKVQSLPDGADKDIAVAELTKVMNTVAPTPLMQKVTSIWRAGLLTSARTLEGGIIGNTTKALLDLPSQAIGAGIDKLITAPLFNNGVRSNIFTLKGSVSGAKEGVKQARDYLKTGIDPRDTASGFDMKGINWEDGNKTLNAVGKGSDLVYRTLGAIDNPFYYSAKGRANFEEAFIEASRRGLKGAEAKDFATDYVNNMSSASQDAATESAKEAVFQNDTILGDFASKLKALPQTIKNPAKRDFTQAIVDFTIPFAKIPGAVATALVDYSPAPGIIKTISALVNNSKGADVDVRALNASIGKSTTGTIGGVWLGSQLYDKGIITLEEPSDAKERQLWQAEGKQKFAIKIGNEWKSMNYIQPLGGLMALGGGYNRAMKEHGDPGKSLITAAATGLKSVTEQSFLQGLSGTVDAIQDPARYAPSLVNSKVGSVIPNFVRDIARATDTAERETNSPIDALNNGIPGLRQNSLPQRDLYGEEIKTRQSPAGVMLDPFKSTQAKNDPVTSELRRLYTVDKDTSVVPTKIDKNQSIGGNKLELSPEQLDKLEGTAGPATKQALDYLIQQPSYQKLADEDKNRLIRKAIDNTRFNARKELASTETFKDKMGTSVSVDPNSLGKFRTPVGSIASSSASTRKTSSLPEGRPERSFLDAASSLSKEDRTKWAAKPVSGEYKPLIDGINKIKPKDLPALPSTNEVAELYSKFQEEKAANKWSPLQTQKESGRLLRDGYKTMLNPDQKFLASLSDADLIQAAQSGKIKKSDIDTLVALDDVFDQLGLSKSIGKKARGVLGYSGGTSRSSGRSGRKSKGGGRKAVGFKAPDKSLYNRIQSTAAIRKLLANAKVTKKGKS